MTRGRQSNSEIRDKIIRTLRNRPMSYWDLKVKTELQVATLDKHLEYLKQIGVIEKVNKKIMGETEELWQLTHGSPRLVSDAGSLSSFIKVENNGNPSKSGKGKVAAA